MLRYDCEAAVFRHKRGEVGGEEIERDRAATTRPPGCAGRLSPVTAAVLPSLPAPLASQGSRSIPDAQLSAFAVPSLTTGFLGSGSLARQPAGQGRSGEAGRPPESAPSYKWEEVAVTQVSRGPWVGLEGARQRGSARCSCNLEKAKAQALIPGRLPAAAASGTSRIRHPATQGRCERRPSIRQSPPDPARQRLGSLAEAGFFFFFFLQCLPTCQLMDLITHSGACSWAAARSIHAAVPQLARSTGPPAPWGRPADTGCWRPPGARTPLA